MGIFGPDHGTITFLCQNPSHQTYTFKTISLGDFKFSGNKVFKWTNTGEPTFAKNVLQHLWDMYEHVAIVVAASDQRDLLFTNERKTITKKRLKTRSPPQWWV